MECFTILADEIEGRLDSHFYGPKFTRLDKKIKGISRKKLADYILSISGGATPSIDESEKYYTNSMDGIPFLRVHNITPEGLNLNDIKFINKETHNEMLKRSQVSEYDLLVKITGVGRMAVSSVAPIGFVGNINQHLVVIKTENENISKVLATFLNSDIGEQLATKRSTGGTRPALDYEALKSIPIVFEPKIVNIYEKAIIRKKKIEFEAKQLLDSISDYVLDELGIKPPKLKDKIVYVINSKEAENKRADAHYYQPKFEKFEKAIKHGNYDTVKIIDVIDKYANDTIRIKNDEKYIYVEIGDVNKLVGTIFLKDEEFGENLPKGSKKKLVEDDVIISTVRPYLKGIAKVKSREKNLISTGAFCVLRCTKKINPDYLFGLVRSDLFIEVVCRTMAGTTYPTVSDEDILNLEIPLPNIVVQNKIAEEVKRRVQKAEQLQKEAKGELEKVKKEVEKIILK